jgi:hypothetical protein
MDVSEQEAGLSRGPTDNWENANVPLEAICLRTKRTAWQRMIGDGTPMPTFKLSKSDRDKVTAAARRIEEPASALLTAVAAYNEALGELRELVRGIEADWQAAWDKRSEGIVTLTSDGRTGGLDCCGARIKPQSGRTSPDARHQKHRL